MLTVKEAGFSSRGRGMIVKKAVLPALSKATAQSWKRRMIPYARGCGARFSKILQYLANVTECLAARHVNS